VRPATPAGSPTSAPPASLLRCIPEINEVLFGGPDPNPACAAVDPASGLPAVFLRDGLFPGRTISVDTRTRGTHMFECLIHPWMQATVTVE